MNFRIPVERFINILRKNSIKSLVKRIQTYTLVSCVFTILMNIVRQNTMKTTMNVCMLMKRTGKEDMTIEIIKHLECVKIQLNLKIVLGIRQQINRLNFLK